MNTTQLTYYYKQLTKPLSKALVAVTLVSLILAVFGLLTGFHYYTSYRQLALSQSEGLSSEKDQTTELVQDSTSSTQSATTYTVGCGDSLWSIAEATYGDGYLFQELAKYNQIANADHIVIDQELTLPSIQVLSRNMDSINKPITSKNYGINNNFYESASSENREKLSYNYNQQRVDTNQLCSIYIVQQGDSLWKIAEFQLNDGTHWATLYSGENKRTIGSDPNIIQPGMVLTMPKNWATKELDYQPCMPE